MKPTDVSDFEWRVGQFCKRLAEFLALCALMIALQGFLTLFNPANPPDQYVTTPKDKQAYLACVRASQRLYGFEWNMAVKACAKRFHESSQKALDLPPR